MMSILETDVYSNMVCRVGNHVHSKCETFLFDYSDYL